MCMYVQLYCTPMADLGGERGKGCDSPLSPVDLYSGISPAYSSCSFESGHIACGFKRVYIAPRYIIWNSNHNI